MRYSTHEQAVESELMAIRKLLFILVRLAIRKSFSGPMEYKDGADIEQQGWHVDEMVRAVKDLP